MAKLSLEHLSKTYANGVQALRDFDLEVADGEFVVLVGPSGCGKTTALRMVAGLEEITDGTLRIGDRVVNEVSPLERDVAMVFQNYALYPHLTVAENIGFSLEMRGVPKRDRADQIHEAASILGLDQLLTRKPRHLSGGQRQRVAMGRAIVRRPAVFLMDEPLSNLDAKLRVQMRAEVLRVQRRLGVATLYVTHDQTEAMTMGDRVAVMRDGVLQQCGEPQDLYDRPANMFVAAFIGSPAMNLYDAVLGEGARSIKLGSQEVKIPDTKVLQHPALVGYAGKDVVVGMRPEHLHTANGGPGPTLTGDVS
ncbi:MAG: ABC transporter ATP-binding protein, partial [Solirubrobacteraceae bacterium]